MSASPGEQALVDEALGRIEDARARLGGRLQPVFEALVRRHRYMLVEDRVDYLGPRAQPIVQLPLWLADEAARRGRPLPRERLVDVLEASITGYLHIRVQDDFCDDGLGEPGAAMLLATQLLARATALVARVVPADHPYWALYESLWLRYAHAMALERDLHAGRLPWTPAAFEAVLERSQPLLLAGAAVLCAADRWEAAAPLAELVRELTRAAQLFDDLMDWRRDRRAGNRTWVLSRLGGLAEPAAIARRLFVDGELDRVFSEIDQALDRARAAAAGLGLVAAERTIAARREATRQAHYRLVAGALEAVLAAAGGS